LSEVTIGYFNLCAVTVLKMAKQVYQVIRTVDEIDPSVRDALTKRCQTVLSILQKGQTFETKIHPRGDAKVQRIKAAPKPCKPGVPVSEGWKESSDFGRQNQRKELLL